LIACTEVGDGTGKAGRVVHLQGTSGTQVELDVVLNQACESRWRCR
jgi:hypothetical protein